MKLRISLSEGQDLKWFQALTKEKQDAYLLLNPDSPFKPVSDPRTIPDVGPDNLGPFGLPSKMLQDRAPTTVWGVSGMYGAWSESRVARKSKSPRSRFMSMLMTKLGGDPGNDIANAFVKPDPDTFRRLMGDLVEKMAQNLEPPGPKAG